MSAEQQEEGTAGDELVIEAAGAVLGPTPLLRWALRPVPVPKHPGIVQNVKVLQQQWMDRQAGYAEWRDVPTVEERP
jgi:hypothetical protein